MCRFAQMVERCAHDRFVIPKLGMDSGGTKQIAGNVLTDKLIVWNIIVESPNKIIPIRRESFEAGGY